MLIVLFKLYFIVLLMIYFIVLVEILRIVLLMMYCTIGFVILRTVLLMMQRVLVSWIRLDDCFMFSLMKMIEIYHYFFQKRLYEVLIWLYHSIDYLKLTIVYLKLFTSAHDF